MSAGTLQHALTPLAWRFLILLGIWWTLSDASLQALAWGVPIAALAAAIPSGLPSAGRWRWRPAGLLRFVPVFFWYNLRGATEVALNALLPGRSPDPELLRYRLRLPSGPSRIFLANLVNLVPGTLCTRIGRDELHVHVLVRSPRIAPSIERLEARVADLFGQELARHD